MLLMLPGTTIAPHCKMQLPFEQITKVPHFFFSLGGKERKGRRGGVGGLFNLIVLKFAWDYICGIHVPTREDVAYIYIYIYFGI